MKTYTIWYRKEPTYWFDSGLKVAEDVYRTCFRVGQIQAACLDEVFQNQQAEVWNREDGRKMTEIVKRWGLRDASMSVGDIAEVNGKFYQVALSCWKQIE
jgi:hypothetical protein